MHYIFFIIISLVWGSAFFLMKQATFAFGPLTIGAISTFGGSAILWGFWAIKRVKWCISRQHIIPLLFVSFFGFSFPFAIQPYLINLIGHGFIGMMVSLVPVLTIVVSIPLLRVFPTRVQFFGVLVGIIGITLIVIDGLNRSIKPLYLLLAVSVPVCYATSNTLLQKSLTKIPPIVLSALLMTISTVVLTPLALFTENITIDDQFITALTAILLLSVFVRGLGMLLFYRLIQSKGPLFAGLVTYVIPVEALLWSWFDNEHITFTQIAAISVVLLVVGVVQRDIVRHSNKA